MSTTSTQSTTSIALLYLYYTMKTITILATLSAAAAAITAPSCSTIYPVTFTFYGWPDNDPPSADIAYDCGRGYTAGGMTCMHFL